MSALLDFMLAAYYVVFFVVLAAVLAVAALVVRDAYRPRAVARQEARARRALATGTYQRRAR